MRRLARRKDEGDWMGSESVCVCERVRVGGTWALRCSSKTTFIFIRI